jgi:DNA gyrase subunit A
MATNIPPHNLTETINACVALIDKPESSVDDLMEHLPAPDFPTHGIVYGLEACARAIARAAAAWSSARARTSRKWSGAASRRSSSTSCPYQVSGDAVLKRIGELATDKKIEGIADLRNESDKKGMRLVIELKRGEVADIVLNNLFKLTQLQDSFGMNMVALVDDQPRVLNLKQFLEFFVTHRREVVTRRTLFDLRKARERGHVLEGLAVAMSNVDEIIALIKASATPPEAKAALMARTWRSPVVEQMLQGRGRFGASRRAADRVRWQKDGSGYRLSDAQAQAILELRLQRLTGSSRRRSPPITTR